MSYESDKGELSVCHKAGVMLGTLGRGGRGGARSEEGRCPPCESSLVPEEPGT